jgi:hypothetical protein
MQACIHVLNSNRTRDPSVLAAAAATKAHLSLDISAY